MYVIAANTLHLTRYSQASSLWNHEHTDRWKVRVREVMPGPFWARLEAGYHQNAVHVHVLAPADVPPMCTHRASAVTDYARLLEYLCKAPAAPTLENCRDCRTALEAVRRTGTRLPKLSFSRGLRVRGSSVQGAITTEEVSSNASVTMNSRIKSSLPEQRPKTTRQQHQAAKYPDKQRDSPDQRERACPAPIRAKVRVVHMLEGTGETLEGVFSTGLERIVRQGTHYGPRASLITAHNDLNVNPLQAVHHPP